MEVKVSSIKMADSDLKNLDKENIKAIIVSSYNEDIKAIPQENKLVLNFADVTAKRKDSFNEELAKKIHHFVDKIDFAKSKLYVCCDSGQSRSAAIAATILRKYNGEENSVWKNYNYHPNVFVYDLLCKEFGLKNSELRLKYKKYTNEKAFREKIKEARR